MADRKMTFNKTKTANSVLKQLGISAALLMASSTANALGLGALEVQSNLEQPLNGTIELRTAPSDDVSSVTAKIAPREDFEKLGIDYPSYMQNISLVLEDAAAGKVLRVRSNDVVINEPFIHFLIRVDWSGGSFLREYTALIDPPVYAAEAPRSFSEPRSVGTDQSYAADDTADLEVESLDDEPSYDDVAVSDPPVEDVTEEDAPLIEDDFYAEPDSSVEESYTDASTSDAAGGYPEGTDARYGPVASGESLSVIAQELQRQFPDLSIYAIMQVLFQENPSAFINGNINGLMQGAVLDIGDLDAIRAVDAAAAKEFFSDQVAAWDPSVLSSTSSSDSISVGQDSYSYNDDVFGSSSSTSSSSGAESFQVGASRDTAEFVSSDQGSREGEVLALRQEISQLETALASSELENQELTERISSLEGQLADMNRLMNLNVESAEMAAVEQTLAEQNTAVEDEPATTVESDTDSVLDEFLGDTNTDLDEFGLNADTAADSQSAVDEFLADSGETVDESTDAVDEFLADTEGDIEELADEASDDFESVLEDATDSGVSDGVVDSASDEAPSIPAISQPESQSFMDKAKSMLSGGLLWGILGGLGAIALGVLGLFFLRRRKADEEFEISMLSIESNSQSLDTMQSDSSSMSASMSASVASVAESVADKETSFLTVYSDSDAVVQADEVDPVAEADVYIAYGRDEQAEEVLLDGIANHPDRVDIKHKLLGLYQKTKNVEGFERVAEEMYSQRELVAPEMWEDVSKMGKELSADNPLFDLSIDDLSTAAASNDLTEAVQSNAEDDAIVSAAPESDTLSFDSEIIESADDSDSNEIDDHSMMVEDSLADDEDVQLINFDEGRSEVSELDDVEIDAIELDPSDSSDMLEFSSSALDDSTPLIDIDEQIDASADDDDDLLTFDTSSSPAPEATLELDAGDDEQSVAEVREVSDLEIDPDYDEARTQFELAKVFVDLGDEDGARKILDELVANGDNAPSVISDAQALLDSINK
jgi:pilus assembly protein FimV